MNYKIRECRICYNLDNINNLISPCLCNGTMKYVHLDCLNKFIDTTDNEIFKYDCYICNYSYSFKRFNFLQIFIFSFLILSFLLYLSILISLFYNIIYYS